MSDVADQMQAAWFALLTGNAGVAGAGGWLASRAVPLAGRIATSVLLHRPTDGRTLLVACHVTTAAASPADGSGAFACDLRLEQAPFTILCTVPHGLMFAPVVPPARDVAPAPRPGGRVVRYDFSGRLPVGVRVPYDPTAFLDVDDWDELPRLDAVRIALPLTSAGQDDDDRWVTIDLALLGERTVVLPTGTDSVTVCPCALNPRPPRVY